MYSVKVHSFPQNIFQDEFFETVDNFFKETLREFQQANSVVPVLPTTEGYPKVDLFEFDDKYQIDATVPGLDRKNISLRVKNGVLILKGSKQEVDKEKQSDSCECFYKEIKRSRFTRSFKLPKNVNIPKIKTELKKGILSIYLPKRTPTPEEDFKIDV